MPDERTAAARELCLIIRVGPALYALPTGHVNETMRPQPVRPVAGSPPFVLGIATIRSLPVPVVDAALVFSDASTSSTSQPTRFVSIKTSGRDVALAVDEVLGVRRIDMSRLFALPPLLSTAQERVISSLGALDGEFLNVLGSGKLLPDDAWAAIDGQMPS